jgi:UDP-N-acetylmuramoylalanine--D-glutamate ligase
MIKDWKNKKVAILGLGVEGLSCIKFLSKKGADITVLDRRNKEAIDNDIYDDAKDLGVKFTLGKDYLQKLSDFDVIFRSPGFQIVSS